MRVIFLFLARVSLSLRRLSNLNPTAEPSGKNLKVVSENFALKKKVKLDKREVYLTKKKKKSA